MFYVKDFANGDVLKVYGVSVSNEGDAIFLFYENDMWIWHFADAYKPI